MRLQATISSRRSRSLCILADVSNNGDGGEAYIFVIRSGGHATFASASNTPGGLTVDLCYLGEITAGEDGETVLHDGLGSGGGKNALFVLLDGIIEPG